MTDQLSFTIEFDKFRAGRKKFTFDPGLHVIYGESGVGKTGFIRQIAGQETRQSRNFKVKPETVPAPVQIVLQNPDHQIIMPTIEEELAFSLECNEQDTKKIQSQLKKIKRNLAFVTDWNRHPSSLSGGEKELLNLEVTLSSSAGLIMIDDGLSFLSPQIKSGVVRRIKAHIHREKCIVLLMTSDYPDLLFSDSSWILSLSSFTAPVESENVVYPGFKLPAGAMNLDISNLTYGYQQPLLFENVNMNIKHVRSLGIVGSNGSGKTTLAKLILGLDTPDNGQIRLSLSGRGSLSVGYLDQFPERMLGAGTLSDLMDDLETIGKLKADKRQQCHQKLMEYQINWRLVKDVSALYLPWSMLRLLLIIILSHCEYDILILDEPTFGFGYNQKLTLHNYLQLFLQKKYLVLVSHDIDYVNSLCDYVYNLDKQIPVVNEESTIER